MKPLGDVILTNKPLLSIGGGYASCAQALRIRLIGDGDSADFVPLPDRQERMYGNLLSAAERLQDINKVRIDVAKEDKRRALDDAALLYVKGVLDSVFDISKMDSERGFKNTIGIFMR